MDLICKIVDSVFVMVSRLNVSRSTLRKRIERSNIDLGH